MTSGVRRQASGVSVLTLALLLASPFGCDDGTPIDPCDRDLACAVEGVDIAILDVEPIWTDEQDYDAGVDMRVVQPGDQITVEVEVMNRGTIDSSDEAELIGYLRDHGRALYDTVTVAPLAVGERATYTLAFDVPDGPRWLGWPDFPEQLDSIGAFRLEHDGYVDADSANDERLGFEFHVAAPVLELRLTDVPDTILTQTTHAVSLVIENHSESEPFDGGLEVELCALYFGADFCEEGITKPFSPVTIGPVPAGAGRIQPFSLRLTQDALWRFDELQHVAIAPCVPRAGDTRECLLPAGFDPATDYGIVAIPNLLVECEPPQLSHLEFLNVGDALCQHDAASGRVYGVAAFEASAGDCWRAAFTTSSSGSIVIRDAATLEIVPAGAPDCVAIERDGLHFVIVYPSSPSALPGGTIQLRQIE